LGDSFRAKARKLQSGQPHFQDGFKIDGLFILVNNFIQKVKQALDATAAHLALVFCSVIEWRAARAPIAVRERAMRKESTRRLALVALTLGACLVAFRLAREWVGGIVPGWVKLTGAVALLLLLTSLVFLVPPKKK